MARAGDGCYAAGMLERYRTIRQASLDLSRTLEPEDMVVQSMPDVSPTKWHLAHVTWFFETFVLKERVPDYPEFHEQFGFLFNSYYQTVGQMHARPRRGLLSRPTVREVLSYRAHVDEHMEAFLSKGVDDDLAYVIQVGLNHEQQHQELLLTDIKHVFAQNPLRPALREDATRRPVAKTQPLTWFGHAGGVTPVGHEGDGFAFDNESPRHDVLLRPFEIASRPVTCGEYLAFLQDGGYERPELWLSMGWTAVQDGTLTAPFYWEQHGDAWRVFTLGGLRDLDEHEPVCHLSYLEADAYARWAGARLPSEHEWEVTAREHAPDDGNFVGSGALHPLPATESSGPTQLFGDVWEWTQSPYQPYPGYAPSAGALGEYNGKFMCSQLVLKGGACTTPDGHARATYRNFFYPPDRWQMTGLRLARDA
jgi:ergothioneine biosynthesis protein EgtB